MTFDDKLAAAKEFLASKGISRRSYAPTLLSSLWRFGFKIPPPHFAGFLGTFIFAGSAFAVAWGLVMWLVNWSRNGTSPVVAAGVSAVAGLMFGLCLAGYYRHAARKYSIPRWGRFVPAGTRRDPS